MQFRGALARLDDWPRVGMIGLIATIVTHSVLANGVPALAHDWWFPANNAAMRTVAHWYADGWSPYGFGSSQPYPTFYLLLPLWYVGSLGFSPLAGLYLCVFGSCVIAMSAACGLLRHQPWYCLWPVCIVAAANPWTYNEYRAGHVYMVLAYALMLALIAEMSRAQPRSPLLCVLVACSVLQIEFTALLCMPLACWLLVTRRVTAFAVLCASLAPIALGIALNYGSLRDTPYGLDWQAAESIHLVDGLLLRGYANDTVHFAAAQTIASVVLAAAALCGVCLCTHNRVTRLVTAAALLATIYASGLSDFFGPSYEWIVLHIKESGLFRELYDLIAVLATAYVFAIAALVRRSHAAAQAVCVAATVLLWPWIVAPVAATTVPLATIPHASLPPNDQYRVLLMPAFQPMSFHGTGSGLDPDAFVTPGSATPINEWLPSFPVTSALGYAARDGDFRWARALGVATVIARPYLASDTVALTGQGTHVAELALGATVRLQATPLLSIIGAPAMLAAVGDRPDEHAIFFGDAMPRRVTAFAPSLLTHDAARAWVDARVDAVGHPEEGSHFGGVVTTSVAALALPRRGSLLGRAEGRLIDDHGTTVIARAGPLAWYRLNPQATSVRCQGRCEAVLVGDPPQGLPQHVYAPPRAVRMVRVEMRLAWLGTASLPAHGDGVLRYNTRFDRGWFAFCDGMRLDHFPLDTAINGWRLTPARRSQHLLLIHLTSCAQAVLEVTAFCVLGTAVFRFRKRGDYKPVR